MALARILGALNGLAIGTILGLAAFYGVTGSTVTSIEGALAIIDIAVMAFAGATTASLATGLKPIPGVAGGVAGGLAAIPVVIIFPPGVIGLPLNAAGGFLGGLVAVMLPGLR